MTRNPLLAGAAVLALALAACGQKDAQTEAVAPDANPAATIPTPADETSATDFVAKAAAGDMFQIEAGRIALERSTNPQVKEFAQMMIDGHTQTTADLKTAIGASGLPLVPPATLPDDKSSALADLRAVDAKDFDKTYIDGQVDVHQASLDLVSRYSQGGDNAQLKAAAATLMPIVQDHLNRARAIRDALK